MAPTPLEPASLAEALQRWAAGELTSSPGADGSGADSTGAGGTGAGGVVVGGGRGGGAGVSGVVGVGSVDGVGSVEGVRAELESAAAHAVAAAGDADLASNPIRLSKRRITELAACERHLVATFDADGAGSSSISGSDPGSDDLHLGVLIDVLAEHFVLTGRPRPDAEPLALGEELCRAHGDKGATLAWLAGLSPAARRGVEERLTEKRDGLLGGWPAFEPAWWPRTQERAVVGLAGGQVVLDGRADVVVGGPPTPWPAVVIEVKSGAFSREQRDDGLFYGLLLALRDGVAPAAAITTTPSAIHVERATGDRLRTASLRLAAAIAAAGELAGGRPPAERPGPRCTRCPDAGACPAGRAWLAGAEAPISAPEATPEGTP